jgi:CDP-glucose 4,6-dehydratase
VSELRKRLLPEINGRVLVTGHTGFKGTWLVHLLKHLEIEVVGISLPPVDDNFFRTSENIFAVPQQYIDIRNYSLLESAFSNFQPEIVIHLAAQPLVLESYKNPIETFSTNVMGTANVLNIASHTDSVRSINVITTDKVYKNLNTGKGFSELDPLEGHDPYSASKVGTESTVNAWRKIIQIQDRTFPILVSRAGNVIGGGDFAGKRLMPDIVRHIFEANNLVIRNPNSTRPWQHVLDPLWGYLLAINKSLKSLKNETYNFGPNEKSLSVSEVITYIKGNYEINFELMEEDLVKKESDLLDLDSSKAYEELGWSPIFNQMESIESTLNWWKNFYGKKFSASELCSQDILNFLNLK